MRESVEELSATSLNSMSYGQTRQGPYSDTLRVKSLWIQAIIAPQTCLIISVTALCAPSVDEDEEKK